MPGTRDVAPYSSVSVAATLPVESNIGIANRTTRDEVADLADVEFTQDFTRIVKPIEEPDRGTTDHEPH